MKTKIGVRGRGIRRRYQEFSVQPETFDDVLELLREAQATVSDQFGPKPWDNLEARVRGFLQDVIEREGIDHTLRLEDWPLHARIAADLLSRIALWRSAVTRGDLYQASFYARTVGQLEKELELQCDWEKGIDQAADGSDSGREQADMQRSSASARREPIIDELNDVQRRNPKLSRNAVAAFVAKKHRGLKGASQRNLRRYLKK